MLGSGWSSRARRGRLRGLRRAGPEHRRAALCRQRDREPDVLPADRRHDRADHRGHGPRRCPDEEIPGRLLANGLRRRSSTSSRRQGSAAPALSLTGTGDLGSHLAIVPRGGPAVRRAVHPRSSTSIYEAFAIAISSTLWLTSAPRSSQRCALALPRLPAPAMALEQLSEGHCPVKIRAQLAGTGLSSNAGRLLTRRARAPYATTRGDELKAAPAHARRPNRSMPRVQQITPTPGCCPSRGPWNTLVSWSEPC